MFVSFHNASFLERLLNKPTESHTGYIQRGGVYTAEVSRASIQLEVQVTSGSAGGEGALSQARWLQWQHVSCGVEVQQGSKHDPGHSQARALGGWSSEFE